MTIGKSAWVILIVIIILAVTLWVFNIPSVGDKFIKNGLQYTILTKEKATGTVMVEKDHNNVPEDIIIPATVKNRGITYSVTEIGYGAFHDCIWITNVTIPESVIKIENLAFWWCTRLKSITVSPNNPQFSNEEGVLFNKDKTTLILCPIGKEETSYTIPDSVIRIGKNAFLDCRHLKSITIPDTVTEIGESAFSWCTLESITIPDTVTLIGKGAFHGCESLKSVYYKGNAPKTGSKIYDITPKTLTSYYPRGNDTWKEAIKDGKWAERGTAEWDPKTNP